MHPQAPQVIWRRNGRDRRCQRLQALTGEGDGLRFLLQPERPQAASGSPERARADARARLLATGSTIAFEEATALVAKGGTVLLFGAPKRGSSAALNIERFFLNGTKLV